ncbi:MAG: hypothetical protein BAA02_03585 [Paenibacillaceae bacterium ZCTH02-B3]|nr:MAG: hypothetical protein BAA02_03585 [Paenibacillaceae bacterium ZCTH02-B3]
MSSSIRRKLSFRMLLAVLAGLIGFSAPAAAADVDLYTAYTHMAATPGQSLTYTIDIINNTGQIQTIPLEFDNGGHEGWEAELTAGGNQIRQISIRPEGERSVTLTLKVPLQVNRGDYTFRVNAGPHGSLPIRVTVVEEGTYRSELTSDQPNLQGHSDSDFSYSLKLNNRTAEKQTYALSADVPQGWDARFQSGGNNITSIEVEPNATQTITLRVTPSSNAAADTYRIPVRASNNTTSAELTLEAVITGTYAIQLTTPDERLSTSITAGGTRSLELLVKNTGSADLTDINLTSTAPANWEVTFEPKTINVIKPGQSVPVTATIKSAKEALPGDYVLSMTASAAEKSTDAVFRVTVKTSMLWGWVGVLIGLAVIGGVYWLMRKYGRR